MQYLNLADFLAKNRFMLPFGNGPEPSLVNEHEFNNWDRFFSEGSQRLAQASMHGWLRLLCQGVFGHQISSSACKIQNVAAECRSGM